jgi:cytidylate kinase
MSDWQTVLQIREQAARKREEENPSPGPYVTISREYGCNGMTLGLLLAEVLNDEAPPGKAWKVYGRDILEQLAVETNLATELIEELRAREPRLLVDFFRSLFHRKIPSGYEIRNRITAIVRGLAYEGYAIIVGQGSAGATADIENGLSIRLEAPLEHRVEQVVKREGGSPAAARMTIRKREKERRYLEKIYAMRFPRTPAFDLVYDDSRFTHVEIAQHVAYMMKLKRFI